MYLFVLKPCYVMQEFDLSPQPRAESQPGFAGKRKLATDP